MNWRNFPQGLVASSGERTRLARCVTRLAGHVFEALFGEWRRKVRARRARSPESANRAQLLIDAFGHDNVYVEIQRHFVRGEERINRATDRPGATTIDLPLLATNGVQYATPYGREVLDVFTCIREHTHLDAAGKLLNAKRGTPSEERCAK